MVRSPVVTPIERENHEDMETTNPTTVPARAAVTGEFSQFADLISYIVSGLLIGLFFDWIFGTWPVFLVVWTLLGVAVGSYRLWQRSAHLDDEGKRRSHAA